MGFAASIIPLPVINIGGQRTMVHMTWPAKPSALRILCPTTNRLLNKVSGEVKFDMISGFMTRRMRKIRFILRSRI